MARVLVFVDRAPGDPEWKGAFAWDLIRGLAESQHQVLALTILDPSEVDISHPRLTIARPAPSWNVMFAPRFLRAVIGFRPEIVHSIGLRSARGFAPLTVWPILNSACVALPGMRRFSTFFDEKDLLEGDPASGWHRGSRRATAFTVRARESLRERLGFDLEIAPLESVPPEAASADAPAQVIVPAAVSEWADAERGLNALREFLSRNPEIEATIVGGWGDLPPSLRREGWGRLNGVADRVHMVEPLSWARMQEELLKIRALWMDPIAPDAWRALLASSLGGTGEGTANFISRLYGATTGA